MKIIFFAAFIASVELLISCDPARRIDMINRSNEDVSIIWTLKEDSAKFSPLFISNSTEVTFPLKTKSPHHAAKMSFGIGTWTLSEVNDLVDDLESLEIQSGNNNLKLTKAEEIKNYLLQNRRGLGNSRIRMLLK
ncbi:MAG: hypothetical protein ABR502_02905 [Chitinophagaceae bacterium]